MSLSALNDRAVADEVTNGFVAASYGERIDNAAGIGSVLTAVNMFDGVTNTAMMTTQSMEYSAFVRSMMPEIRHIEESELQGIFAANFPQWNPDRCDSVMKANRWDRYTYDVSRNGDYQTLTRAWYAYNEGLDMFIAKTMEAVGLMYSGSAAQANAALREIRDAFEGKSPMARFGVEYPSVNDMILCCAECIESDPSHVREMQSNGKDRRDAMQYHLDHDPNAAGTGDGEDNPPNPAEQARREKQYWDNFRDLQSTLIGESTRGVDVYGTVVALLGYDGGLAVIHDIMGRLSPSARAIVEEDLRRAGTALPMVDINQTSIPDLENVGLSADLIIQLRDALQYASPADLANLQNMIASAHDARQDGNELIALLQGDRVTSIDVVAGPAPSQLEREIDNEIVMDAVQDTSLFDETYGQTRDLLQLIQKGFQDTIDEYQFRLDNAAQAFLQGKNRSALEKAALAAEVLSTAAVKSALVGLKAAVPSTPEALLIDTAMLLSGTALLKVYDALGAVLARFDTLAGTRIAQNTASVLDAVISKTDDLSNLVENTAKELVKTVSEKMGADIPRILQKTTQGQDFWAYGKNLHGMSIDSNRATKGFLKGMTELGGGKEGAKNAFKEMTGILPTSKLFESTLADGTKIIYREISDSSLAKIEIRDFVHKIVEFISFQ
jgi:hypothetical protein